MAVRAKAADFAVRHAQTPAVVVVAAAVLTATVVVFAVVLIATVARLALHFVTVTVNVVVVPLS